MIWWVFLIWFFIFGFFAALVFLVYLVFWFFDDFLMIFWFFYDFFFWLLLCFYSPKWVQFLKFSCNSFFLEYNGWRWWGDAVNITAWSLRLQVWYLTGYALVYVYTPESIKKYKTVALWFSRRQRLQVAWLIFSGSTL